MKGRARKITIIKKLHKENEKVHIVSSDDDEAAAKPNTDDTSTNQEEAKKSTSSPGDGRGAYADASDMPGDILSLNSPNTENSLQ